MTPPGHRTLRAALASVVIASICAACSTSTERTEQTLAGIGRIPGAAAAAGVLTVDGVRADVPATGAAPLGTLAAGNRLLVVGDSIMAGTASRYGGAMCAALVPLGWQVAVEAEAGRMVEFGRTVVRERIVEGWDAAVVFLGTNYGGNEKTYESDLSRIVVSLGPRPTLLLTATEFKPSIAQVNRAIRRVAAANPHAVVLDWGAASLQPGILNRDKVHPTDAGRKLLVGAVATALGNAPTPKGKCLPSLYTDDSLVLDDDVLPATTVDPGSSGFTGTTVPVSTTVTVGSETTTTTVAG